MHRRGLPWARIGEFVGQRDLTVTANTYTHVLLDETRARLPGAACRGRVMRRGGLYAVAIA